MHELISFLTKCAKWYIIFFVGIVVLIILMYVIGIHEINKMYVEDEATPYYYYYNSAWENAEVENESTML